MKYRAEWNIGKKEKIDFTNVLFILELNVYIFESIENNRNMNFYLRKQLHMNKKKLIRA